MFNMPITLTGVMANDPKLWTIFCFTREHLLSEISWLNRVEFMNFMGVSDGVLDGEAILIVHTQRDFSDVTICVARDRRWWFSRSLRFPRVV